MELTPPTPQLELLCHVAVKIAAPQLIGLVLTGDRLEGPKMRGEFLPGGAAWQIVGADGTALL